MWFRDESLGFNITLLTGKQLSRDISYTGFYFTSDTKSFYIMSSSFPFKVSPETETVKPGMSILPRKKASDYSLSLLQG